MAVVSPLPAIAQRANSLILRDIGVSGTMASSRQEIVEESVARVIDDTVYVAVGKDLKENKSILVWTVQNSGGKKICIIHVHQPAQMIPMMGAKFPASSLKEQEVRIYREIERQNMHKNMDEYLLICRRMGIRAEKLHIEMDCIEKGVVELISQHGIRKLVMGAAADKQYSRRMMDIKSKKGIYVRQHAPASCHIQFVCKGHLIYTREGSLHGADVGVSCSPQASPNILTGQSNHLRLRSATIDHNTRGELTSPAQDLFRRVRSDAVEGSYEWDGLSGRSPSQSSGYSTCSSSDAPVVPYMGTEESENGIELCMPPQPKEDLRHSSPPSVLEGSIDDTLYGQLEQAMAEARNARRESYQETVRRGKAEKDAIDSIRRAKASESYTLRS